MAIRSEVITVGSELLRGATADSNAQYIGRRLSEIGIQPAVHTSCDDKIYAILQALEIASARADLIIMTGGLGATPDDVTRLAVSKFFHQPLEFNQTQYRRIVRYFRKSRKKLLPITKIECFFPAQSIPIANETGIALGFAIRRTGKLFVVLPGVPREMQAMFDMRVVGLIRREFKALRAPVCLQASIIGLNEPEIMQKLGRNFFSRHQFDFGIYPNEGWVTVRLLCQSRRSAGVLQAELSRRFGSAIYEFSDRPIEHALVDLLTKRRLTIAAAESCTGGWLGKRLTDVVGASRVFSGGVLAYSNEAKLSLLGVRSKTLKTYGAVSKAAALEMAQGVRLKLRSDIGLSITGIAGPAGGSRAKPVGLIWIGMSVGRKRVAQSFCLRGARDRIRSLAVQRALILLYAALVRTPKR